MMTATEKFLTVRCKPFSTFPRDGNWNLDVYEANGNWHVDFNRPGSLLNLVQTVSGKRRKAVIAEAKRIIDGIEAPTRSPANKGARSMKTVTLKMCATHKGQPAERRLEVMYVESGRDDLPTLAINDGRDLSTYTLAEIPAPCGRGFTLLAHEPKKPRDFYDGKSYSVLVSENPTESTCDCTDHQRYGYCKHVASLTQLCEDGTIPHPLAGAPVQPHPTPEQVAHDGSIPTREEYLREQRALGVPTEVALWNWEMIQSGYRIGDPYKPGVKPCHWCDDTGVMTEPEADDRGFPVYACRHCPAGSQEPQPPEPGDNPPVEPEPEPWDYTDGDFADAVHNEEVGF